LLLYRAIAEDLRASFARSNYADGHPLPSEHELCRAYGASRTTIRAALDWLERRGLVRRRQGSGTFYKCPAITKHLGSLIDFHTEAVQAGRRPRTVVLGLTVRPPSAVETVVFGKRDSRHGISELTRVRYLDGDPAVLQRSYLSCGMLGRVKAAKLNNTSLYGFLASRRGVNVHSIEETLEPAVAEGEEAEQLHIAPGTPVFRSHRIARDSSGRVIEISDNLVRGDIYRFAVRRAASEGVS
jgi:GntR family transcriptional regulator